MANDMGGETILPLLLNRYRVEGKLGEGGLGTVVRTFDTRLKRTVAIKTLKRSSYTLDPDLFRALEERFAREAEAGSRMGSHPNLVTVYDLVVDSERTQYLILEYVPGGTLADRVKDGPLPLDDALRLTADAARGLMAAHERGIIHRDVKPSNIFLGEDGRAQVGDFGIAQIDDLSRRTSTTASHPGTPLYMSPEQAHSTGYVRPSSDQYSLGLVLFEMLTGQAYKRLERPEADALLARQPMPVAVLMNRMLAAEPGDRYPGMAGLLAAIQAIAAQPAEALSFNLPTVPAPPRNDAITQPQRTPILNLQPVPPVLDRPSLSSPLASQTSPVVSRRAILIGAGGLIVAAGAGGAVMGGLRRTGGATPIATLPAATVASTATSMPPTAIPSPTPSPTAPALPVAAAPATPAIIVVTAPPPIVITAPPVVITATPVPATSAPVVQAASGSTTAWSDAENRIALSYSTQRWHAITEGTDQFTIFGLQNTIGVYFYVSKYVRGSANAASSALEGLQGYKQRQTQIPDRTYVQGSIQTLRIDSANAAAMDFQWTKKSDPSVGRVGTVRYVDGPDRQFVIETFVDGKSFSSRDDVNAIMTTVRIAK